MYTQWNQFECFRKNYWTVPHADVLKLMFIISFMLENDYSHVYPGYKKKLISD